MTAKKDSVKRGEPASVSTLVTLSEAATALFRIDQQIIALNQEIHQDAIRIAVMQEARAEKGERVRELEKKARLLMRQQGAL